MPQFNSYCFNLTNLDRFRALFLLPVVLISWPMLVMTLNLWTHWFHALIPCTVILSIRVPGNSTFLWREWIPMYKHTNDTYSGLVPYITHILVCLSTAQSQYEIFFFFFHWPLWLVDLGYYTIWVWYQQNPSTQKMHSIHHAVHALAWFNWGHLYLVYYHICNKKMIPIIALTICLLHLYARHFSITLLDCCFVWPHDVKTHHPSEIGSKMILMGQEILVILCP